MKNIFLKISLILTFVFVSLFFLVQCRHNNQGPKTGPLGGASSSLVKEKPSVDDTSLVNQVTKEREKRESDKKNKNALEPKKRNTGFRNQSTVTYQKMKMGGGVGDTLMLPIRE